MVLNSSHDFLNGLIFRIVCAGQIAQIGNLITILKFWRKTTR